MKQNKQDLLKTRSFFLSRESEKAVWEKYLQTTDLMKDLYPGYTKHTT